MTHYENHAPVSNQVGIQNVYGNLIIDGNSDSYERLRYDNNGSITEKVSDNNILNSLAFPQMLDRRADVESAHQHTCQWLFDLDEYQSWKEEPRGLLWVKGKPGSGKSTLMSHLHCALLLERQAKDTSHVNLEFFFSARGTILQHSFTGMLRSLLNQIFSQDDSVRQYLRDAYKEKYSSFGGRTTAWEWQLAELQRLFMDTMLASAQQRQITLLIDALDEAGEETAREIASFFHTINDRIATSVGMAKICISCRHYPIASKVKAAEIYVEDHNHDDIVSYVRDHIVEEVFVDNVDHELREVFQAIVDRATGVFQWARLIVPMVIKWLGEGDTTRQILINLSQIPEDLAATYKYILTGVVDPRHRKKTLRLFQWACLAQRPLSVDEIQVVLLLDIGIEEAYAGYHASGLAATDSNNMGPNISRQIMTWSGGLVEVVSAHKDDEVRSNAQLSVPRKIKTVQVIHQSVRDFMVAQGLSFLLGLNNDHLETGSNTSPPTGSSEAVQRSHSVLYSSCLMYMCAEKPKKGVYRSPNDVNQKYSFLDYSACYGLKHAEKAGDHRGFDLKDETRILRQSFPMWIFAFGIPDHCFYDHVPHIATDTTVLHLASLANLDSLTTYRIRCGDDPNKMDATGWTPMHLAANYGHLSMVVKLHKSRAKVHRQTAVGDTPLLLAAQKGHVDVFAFLTTCGANFDATNFHSESVIYTAALNGSVAICRLCIEAGIDVNAQRGFFGNALQAAASRGNDVVVRLLLEAGAVVNAQGGNYGNALQAAAYIDSEEVVELLLDAGADINAQGGHFGSALQAGAYQGCSMMIEKLLDAGANVNAQGGHFGNALQAAVYQKRETVVPLLLEAGADIKAQGGIYGNALQAAASVGNEQLVNLFLESGADVNTQGGHFGNALQAAAFRGNKPVIRLLLDAGADVNAQGGYYGTAIRAAYFRSGKEIMDMLTAAGAASVEHNPDGGNVGVSPVANGAVNEASDEQLPPRDVRGTSDHTTEDHSNLVAADPDWHSNPAEYVSTVGSWLSQTLTRFLPQS